MIKTFLIQTFQETFDLNFNFQYSQYFANMFRKVGMDTNEDPIS